MGGLQLVARGSRWQPCRVDCCEGNFVGARCITIAQKIKIPVRIITCRYDFCLIELVVPICSFAVSPEYVAGIDGVAS